jgi:plasmid stabilization system protein ParE
MNAFYRPQFLRDMAREELYLLEKAGAETADRWHESLWRTVEFIAQQPLLGRLRQLRRHPDIRSWLVQDFERWIVFYEAAEDEMIFHRVVYGMRDLNRLRFR